MISTNAVIPILLHNAREANQPLGTLHISPDEGAVILLGIALVYLFVRLIFHAQD